MKRSTNSWRRSLMLLAALAVLSASASADQASADSASPRSKLRLAPPGAGLADHYFVVLDDTLVRSGKRPEAVSLPSSAQAGDVLVARNGGRVLKAWSSLFPVLYVKMPAAAARRMAGEGVVRYVEQVTKGSVPSTSATSCYPSVAKSAPSSSTKSHSVHQILDCPALDPRFHVLDGNCTPGVDCYDCSDNWGLARINQPAVPQSTSFEYDYDPPAGAPTVHVYMVDTGVDSSLDDCTGHGHGTHTSGIALGSRYGVAKDAVLHPIKFLDSCDYSGQVAVPVCPNPAGGTTCGGDAPEILDALMHIGETHSAAFGSEPAVVNLSANLLAENDTVSLAAQELIEQHDIQLIQSAGNNDNRAGLDTCTRTLGTAAVPAEVLVVGGTDIVEMSGQKTDVRWIREGININGAVPPDPSHFVVCQVQAENCLPHRAHFECDCGSNTGSCVDMWAPAAHIVSASKDFGVESCRLSGTSMAAPHVTGVAARILMDFPNATPEDLRLALKDYAVEDAIFDQGDPSVSFYSIGNSANLLAQAHLAPLSETWVDFASTRTIELGTENLPYDTLTEGIDAVVEGTVLNVFAGTTVESVVISKSMTLRAVGGPVRITAPAS